MGRKTSITPSKRLLFESSGSKATKNMPLEPNSQACVSKCKTQLEDAYEPKKKRRESDSNTSRVLSDGDSSVLADYMQTKQPSPGNTLDKDKLVSKHLDSLIQTRPQNIKNALQPRKKGKEKAHTTLLIAVKDQGKILRMHYSQERKEKKKLIPHYSLLLKIKMDQEINKQKKTMSIVVEGFQRPLLEILDTIKTGKQKTSTGCHDRKRKKKRGSPKSSTKQDDVQVSKQHIDEIIEIEDDEKIATFAERKRRLLNQRKDAEARVIIRVKKEKY